jgi:two-component system phosphate regulon sensor histidine kinase PhoR
VRLGLFGKLFALFALTLFIAMAITDVAVRRSWERSFRRNLQDAMTEKVEGLRETLPEIRGCNVPASDRGVITDIVRRQAAAMKVRVTVIDRCGVVLADSAAEAGQMENHATRPEFHAALQDGTVGSNIRNSRTLNIPFLYVAAPARGEGEHGAVRVSYPLNEIEQQSQQIRNKLFLASVGGLLVALVLAIVASAVISARSRRIMDFANRVAEGDFSARLHERTYDEFAAVAKSLNTTAEKLEESFQQVRESRERLETLLNSMQEAVLAVSADRRVQWFNLQAERIAGPLRTGTLLVESVRDPELLRVVRTTIETGEVSTSRSDMISPGRIFRVTSAPISSGGAVAVLTEITEIEKTEKVRRDFIANVSHELRTPLTSIQGYTETILENAPPSEQRQFLEIIRKNAKRMTRLTEDLLTLARVESGEDALRLRPVLPSVILADCAESMRDVAKLSGRELAVENDTEHPVRCDLDKIHQVMTNLVENAIRYGGAKVTIGAKDSETGVRFYVKDDGPGIPSEHISRLFERFYRVDRARSVEGGGTGLGLAIVKHIVLKHGGTVHAHSELSKGSTFSFVLPFADEPAPVFTENS